MFRFKRSHLFLLLALIVSADSFAAGPFCIATNGGWGQGGTTFIAPSFAVPAESGCAPWSGFTKTATTVLLISSGTGCLSFDGKKLSVSVSNADPDFLGAGSIVSDYIVLSRSSSTGAFTSVTDMGNFGGSAELLTCTSSILHLSDSHD